jgi:hypothetical protein
VELRFGTLTLWTFELPDASDGDAVRIYNSGRSHGGALDWATYYEMNCFSAAQQLQPEQLLTYGQGTLHLTADNTTLGNIVRQIFDISLEDISRKMFR